MCCHRRATFQKVAPFSLCSSMPCHLPVALLIPHDAATSALTAAVNRVAREVHQCQTLDPGSLSRSGERGTDAEPVFFVTCGSGAAMRNMWFKLDEIGRAHV